MGCRQQVLARTREAEEIEDVGLRSVGNAPKCMRQLVQRDADEQVRIDIGREGREAVIGGVVVGRDQPQRLRLRVGDKARLHEKSGPDIVA